MGVKPTVTSHHILSAADIKVQKVLAVWSWRTAPREVFSPKYFEPWGNFGRKTAKYLRFFFGHCCVDVFDSIIMKQCEYNLVIVILWLQEPNEYAGHQQTREKLLRLLPVYVHTNTACRDFLSGNSHLWPRAFFYEAYDFFMTFHLHDNLLKSQEKKKKWEHVANLGSKRKSMKLFQLPSPKLPECRTSIVAIRKCLHGGPAGSRGTEGGRVRMCKTEKKGSEI